MGNPDDATPLVRGFGKPTEPSSSFVQLARSINAPDPTDDVLAQRATGHFAKAALDGCQGEIALMIAVIDEALDTVTCEGLSQATRHSAPYSTLTNAMRKRRDKEAALLWFFYDDPDEADYTFSFRSICETLGFDVGWIRAGLRKLVRNDVDALAVKARSKYSVRRVLYRSASVSLARRLKQSSLR